MRRPWAKQANANFSPSRENLSAITRICQLVEGLPLGLELAATWVRMMSLNEVAREIERNTDAERRERAPERK